MVYVDMFLGFTTDLPLWWVGNKVFTFMVGRAGNKVILDWCLSFILLSSILGGEYAFIFALIVKNK